MTHFDSNLIFLFSENCRSRIKDLSVQLKKSPQRLKYSLQVLEREGVVDNVHCIFDYSYFGLILFRVYFRGGYISEKDKTTIINTLTQNHYVVAVYELTGEFDLAVEFVAPNPSRFNKELKKITEHVPTLKDYKILLNLVTHIYPRFFLIKDDNLKRVVRQEVIIGGDRATRLFEPEELTVMKNLLNDPRLRISSLAEQSGLSPKTAKKIFKRLQKRKILKGFKFLINTNKLGMFKSRLFIRLHNLTQETEKELFDYLASTPEIIQLHKTVGDWDMEIDVESFDKSRIRFLIVQMRESFSGLIQSFNTIEYYQVYKKAYLPEYLFESE